MTDRQLEALKKALDESRYTVAVCGSGMLEECGNPVIKNPKRAYDIEQKYGISPEYIFTDAYFSTRTARFFEFYRNEMLLDIKPTIAAKCLASLEAEGKLNSVITANIYELPQRAGCKNVINIHGSIFHNRCPRCKKEYSLDYIKESKKVPLCEECGAVIRPQLSLFGDMLDSAVISRATEEIEKADVLLILGTTLDSEVFGNYFKYFEGSKMILIHENVNRKDKNADLVIYGTPGQVLAQLECC